jgi:hypothetical protein
MAKPWPLAAERDLWRDKCHDSFYWFARVAWGIEWYMRRNTNDAWFSPRVHKPLCDWLQLHVEDWEAGRRHKRRKKLAVIIPRGFGKTVLITKALNAWLHVRNPDTGSMIGSEVQTKAEDFMFPIAEVLSGSDPHAWFPWLFGVWKDPDRIWTRKRFVHGARVAVSKTEPSFGTWGVDSGITGLHPDVGILDDPLSEEKIRESGTWIKTVNQSVAALRPAFRSDSLFILVCTRYRDNDVAGTFLNKNSEGVRSWTGMPTADKALEIIEVGQWDVYFLQALDENDESILPEVHPTSQLHEYRRSHPAEFSAQMMNDPASGEHMELSGEQIDEMWIAKADLPSNLRYTMHIDVAFKTEETKGSGDESVIEVWAHDARGTGDVYYIEGYGSDSWRVEDFTTRFINLLKKYRSALNPIIAYTDEKEALGRSGTWRAYLRGACEGDGVRLPRVVECQRQGRNKLQRIREALAFWVDGHVKLVKDAPGVEFLIYQALRVGYSRHDDWVDAMADVFHQEIYKPFLLGRYDKSPLPTSPGDDILKGRMSNNDVRKLYDIEHAKWVSEEAFQRSLSDPAWAR